MTITAGTVVNREGRIRVAATQIALAYLRNLREGDHVRASVILAAFQRFWTENRAQLVPADATSPGIPVDLRATGMLDQPTQNAVLFLLYRASIVPFTVAQPAFGVAPLSAMVAPYLPAPTSALWDGYEASFAALPQNAGVQIGHWAASYADGVRSPVSVLPLEEDSEPPLVQPDPTDPIIPGPEIPVTGQRLERKPPTLWPWIVVGVGGVLLYAGFVYKKKRRGRR